MTGGGVVNVRSITLERQYMDAYVDDEPLMTNSWLRAGANQTYTDDRVKRSAVTSLAN